MTGTPHSLWDHCMELVAKVRSAMLHRDYAFRDHTPESIIMNRIKDISHLCEFQWFQWVGQHLLFIQVCNTTL